MEFRVHIVEPVQHYFASSWEEMCIVYAEKYFIRSVTCMEDGWNCFKYKGPAKAGYQNRSAICMGTAPGGDQTYETSTCCTEGRQHPTQGVFGCFEYLECDPAKYSDPSEMPKNCSKPVLDRCDPKNNANGIVPEDCPKNKPDEKPDTPEPECSVEHPLTKEGKPAYGAVACNGEKRKACGWSNPNIEDSKAREIVKKCTLVHEGLHIKNELCYGGDCVNGYMKDADKPYNWFDEITSYQGELLCLEEKKSEWLSDRNCLNGLEMAKVNAQSQMSENMNIYCDNNLEDCIKNDGVVLRCKP